MDTRRTAWLVVLVIAGLLVPPSPAAAERLPTRRHQEMTLENDPWRPDTHDPGRALADRDQVVLDEPGTVPTVRQPARHEAWHRVLLRIFRLRFVWGVGK